MTISHPDLTPDQHTKRPLILLHGQLRQPGSASCHPGSDDALLRLQKSFQTWRADLKGERPSAEARGSTEGQQGPHVQVGAGGDNVVLGHFLPAPRRQRGGGGGAAARCRCRSFQGADGRCVEPFEVGGGVRGCERRVPIRRRRRGDGIGVMLQLETEQEKQL